MIPAEPQLKRVTSRSYSHLSEAYSDIFVDGQFTVDIKWIEVVDNDKPLNTSELKKKQEFKGAFFDPRRSGSNFKEEYVNLLDHYWEAHLVESIKQGCGARRENI